MASDILSKKICTTLAASAFEMFASVLVDPNKKSKVVEHEAVEKAFSFSTRKDYLDYLTGIGAKYKLKQAKSDETKHVELQAAIPIVRM